MIQKLETTVMQLLTHSRQQAFKVCRKQSWFGYELGIRRSLDAKALRMGSAYHAGQETLSTSGEVGSACEVARSKYQICPDAYEQLEWEYERETVERLLCGYAWRWKNSPLEYLAPEKSFELPLLNPETGAASTVWNMAGKIDGVVRLEDGRLAVQEFKLLGDDISTESDLWRRLRIDHQISLYVYAARQLGFDVATVLYDVTRKPTIKPAPISLLDELGVAIVLDANGERVKTQRGVWRTTADKDKGYVLQTRAMTPSEWGEKLTDDIVSRPDYYFRRQEVPRLDSDILEYQQELWEIQKTLREAQRTNRWYRTAHKNTCDFCAYFALCTTGSFDPNGPLPEGFIRVDNVNPELNNVNNTSTSASQETTAAAN